MLIANWMLLILSNAFLLLMLVTSIIEKENRAVLISFLGIIFNSSLWLLFIFREAMAWVSNVNLGIFILVGVMGIISLLKWFPKYHVREVVEAKQFDERDYMFARNNLKFHPDLAEQYYETHPEKKEIDAAIHKKTEIGEPGQVYYDEDYTPVSEAAFGYLFKTREVTWAEPAEQKKEINKEKFMKVIKEMARFYGAVDVGLTKLKPYHFYSHTGRRAENWGKPVPTDHPTAVAIVVAMDVDMMQGAPALPAILESSRQYVEAAKIANMVAEYIRFFGYEARAHTDGNYQVMCVPVAIDAGLGELGRLGLMMHPIYGPCVRISVVTTELDLGIEERQVNHESASIYNFCKICKKCADNCPTNSITKELESHSRGFRHWSINQETCFSYWKNIGTDCGFCITVCPYTKPNTPLHKLVRWYIARNPINQQIALFMDDFFYGRNKKISNTNPEKIII